MPVNQRNMIPRFPGASGALLGRGVFLDGHKKCYFMSGQAPDGMSDGAGYRNPLDWPKAGTLLRVPQMVWLSAAFIDADPNHSQQPYSSSWDTSASLIYVCNNVPNPSWITYSWTDGHTEVYNGSTMTPGDGAYVVDHGGGSFSINLEKQPPTSSDTTTPNWSDLEYQRLMPIFQAAHDTILELRPNRTWVDIVDWDDFNNWPNLTLPPNPDGTIDIGNRYGHMIAPDPSEEFLGTRFLHLYCGGLVDAGPGVFDSPSLETTSDSTYTACKAQIVGSFPLFADYSVRLYSVGALGQQTPMPAAPSIPVPGAPCADPSEDRSGTIIAENAFRVTSVDSFNAKIQAYGTDFDAYYKLVASDLEPYGYTYNGDSSLITGSDQIVELIAAYFGFDPITGADL